MTGLGGAPFVMLGEADAAACEGDACLVLPASLPTTVAVRVEAGTPPAPETRPDADPRDAGPRPGRGPEAPVAPVSGGPPASDAGRAS